MVLPLKNIIYDLIKSEKNTTDVELMKLLKKQNIEKSKNDINKALLHLEIMNLISVRWMGKNSKRIEVSENDGQKSNALW
jgi:arginine repressor|tara:strand:- start:144 stop:383 length:240 start_codon:yes stop_codon:yes gene_type:complete